MIACRSYHGSLIETKCVHQSTSQLWPLPVFDAASSGQPCYPLHWAWSTRAICIELHIAWKESRFGRAGACLVCGGVPARGGSFPGCIASRCLDVRQNAVLGWLPQSGPMRMLIPRLVHRLCAPSAHFQHQAAHAARSAAIRSKHLWSLVNTARYAATGTRRRSVHAVCCCWRVMECTHSFESSAGKPQKGCPKERIYSECMGRGSVWQGGMPGS